MTGRILSLSYDLSLLHTRQLLLEAGGFVVVSKHRIEEALETCQSQKFDLVIVGHSVPAEETQLFITSLRAVCSTPVIALQLPNRNNNVGASYRLDVTAGPQEFLRNVRTILAEIGTNPRIQRLSGQESH